MYNQYDIYILQNLCDTRASHGLESSIIIIIITTSPHFLSLMTHTFTYFFSSIYSKKCNNNNYFSALSFSHDTHIRIFVLFHLSSLFNFGIMICTFLFLFNFLPIIYRISNYWWLYFLYRKNALSVMNKYLQCFKL